MSVSTRKSITQHDLPEVQEKEEKKSVLGWLYDAFYDFYLDFIPSDDVKTYHPRYFLPLSIVIVVLMLGLFAAFFVPSYQNERTSRYLAPSSDDNPRYCDSVTISNSGTFYATKEGYWVGSPEFVFSNTSYFVSINNLLVSVRDWKRFMDAAYRALSFVGNVTASQDLGANLLLWMSFALTPLPNQMLAAAGNPLNVFDRERTVTTLGSINGPCLPANSVSSFSKSEGTITVTWDYDDFMNNPVCPTAMTPELFGYVDAIDRNKFSLSVDVRTVITSIAVNEGILSLSDLEIIANTNSAFPYTINGKEIMVNASDFYDPRYPGMFPVSCLTDVNAGVPNVCIIILGEVIALPLFSHRGFSTVEPIRCDCSNENITQDLDNVDHTCNRFTFLTGLLYYDTADPQALLDLVINQTYAGIQRKTFEPMYVDSAYGLPSPNFFQWTTADYRRASYSFCERPPYGNCSIIIFSSFDLSYRDFTVNEFYYQIPNGACRDIFITSEENWQKLTDTPFAPLDQEYVVCTNSLQNSLINSVGVSVSNTQLITPFLIMLIIALVLGYQKCCGVYVPRGYNQNDKDQVIDDLAVLLLLAKDHKIRIESEKDSKKVRNLLTSRLMRELIALQSQLPSQYEPTEDRPRPLFNWKKLYRKLANKQKEAKAGESKQQVDLEGGDSEEEAMEMHYGHYGVVPTDPAASARW